MRSAQRLGHDAIDNPQPQEILSGQPQRLCRLLGVLAIPPQDRGAALGRDHRINRVLKHQHGIAGSKRDRAPDPPSPMTEATRGTSMSRLVSIARAIASA